FSSSPRKESGSGRMELAGPKGPALRTISASLQREHLVSVEFCYQTGAVIRQPLADGLAASFLVEAFVHNRVGGARIGEHAPGEVGPLFGMAQDSGVQLVAQREGAAVAVDQRMPVTRRIKNVPQLVRPLAKW